MTAALIALLGAVTIVMTAASYRYQRRRQRGGHATSRDDKIFATAPRWAGRLNEKLNEALAGQRRLHQLIGREARADERRDFEMSAGTQAAIDELKAEVAPITDAVSAVSATVDRLIAMVEQAGDDPDEIRAVIANLRTEKERIIAAALKGTPIEASGN